MTVGFGPLWTIDGPQPQAPLYSLLGSAAVIDDFADGGVPRWANGVEVYPYPPDNAHVHDACATGTSRSKAVGGSFARPEFGALTVYVTETCTTASLFGEGVSAEEAQTRFVARARAVLGAIESSAVERELLTGEVLGLNPHLADGNGTFPWLDTATTVANGFAVLDNAIAKSGRRGMIHCSPGLASAAYAARVLTEDGRTNSLRTVNGTVVVPGFGYAEVHGDTRTAPPTHTSPSDVQEWAYATGPVEVRRSDVFVIPESFGEAFDRGQNTVEYRAERLYVVDWDTAVQASVLIDRCTTTCGSPA